MLHSADMLQSGGHTRDIILASGDVTQPRVTPALQLALFGDHARMFAATRHERGVQICARVGAIRDITPFGFGCGWCVDGLDQLGVTPAAKVE